MYIECMQGKSKYYNMMQYILYDENEFHNYILYICSMYKFIAE